MPLKIAYDWSLECDDDIKSPRKRVSSNWREREFQWKFDCKISIHVEHQNCAVLHANGDFPYSEEKFFAHSNCMQFRRAFAKVILWSWGMIWLARWALTTFRSDMRWDGLILVTVTTAVKDVYFSANFTASLSRNQRRTIRRQATTSVRFRPSHCWEQI